MYVLSPPPACDPLEGWGLVFHLSVSPRAYPSVWYPGHVQPLHVELK